MFVDHENLALNVKIAIIARDIGRAPADLRTWAASLPATHEAELLEPAAGSLRLVSLDYFLPPRKDGYRPHPHLYAIDATSTEPASEYELHSLQHGADAVIDLDALDARTLADAIAAAIASAARSDSRRRP